MANRNNGNTAIVSPPKMEAASVLNNEPPEVREAKLLAARYRLPYIDVLPPNEESPIDYEEIAHIPVELMLRNQFVPLKREGRNLHVAMADPSNLFAMDGRTTRTRRFATRRIICWAVAHQPLLSPLRRWNRLFRPSPDRPALSSQLGWR